MIEILLISAMLSYIPTEDRTGRMPYPSGIKDFDNTCAYDWTNSDCPVLTIPMPIYDLDYNIIPIGNYQTKLSENGKEILLIQIGKVIGKIPVIKTIALPEKNLVPEARSEIMHTKNLLIILKGQDMELYSIVYPQY